MVELELGGCRPEPLAHYLKALAVLRLVAEQKDLEARGFWRGDVFVLRSCLDREALVHFLVDEYRPTPIVAPWNGGSGFWPKDNHEGFDAIRDSTTERLAAYRATIAVAEAVVRGLGLADGGEDTGGDWKVAKAGLIAALRSELPDEALSWMDAALVLTPDGANFPPLLGTGGNDGRLDFSNNQMQRLTGLLLQSKPDPRLAAGALFGDPVAGLRALTVGQFLPSGLGGANSGPGFDGKGAVNPWDFVLMLEGALVPSAVATRRLESDRAGAMSFPFTVRSSGVGYGSAAAKDEDGSRDEMWLPLWSHPTSLAGLRSLFAEGRGRVSSERPRATAVTGADFARALASLGVDRGIDRFVRYCFLQRNGLSFLATPLATVTVTRQPLVDVLAPLDRWLDVLKRVGSDNHAPSSWQRARQEVEQAVLDVCSGRSQGLMSLLLALASAERVFAHQIKKAIDKSVRPVPRLPFDAWIPHLREQGPEYRLAASLASVGYRRRIVPLTENQRDWDPQSRACTFGNAALADELIASLQREVVERAQGQARASMSAEHARLDDILAYIEGRVDDTRLLARIHALSLLDGAGSPGSRTPSGRSPGPAYALAALAWDRHPRPGVTLPDTPSVLGQLVGERITDATRTAASRLRASGLSTKIGQVPAAPGTGRRIASALAFPLSFADKGALLASLGVPAPEPVE